MKILLIVMATKEQNQKYFNDAMSIHNKLAANPSTPKNIRKSITDLINDLKTDDYSISVRAANAISLLDDITQDPNVPSYVRTSLWQAVSTLENIRE